MSESRLFPSAYQQMMEHFFAEKINKNHADYPIPGIKNGIYEMQHELERIVKDALGQLPSVKSPLNAQVIRRVDREDYAIEVIQFESQPNIWVSANLYLPAKISNPRPAILCPHGHYLYGKTQPDVQMRCIGLARRGFIALAPDKMGYGERAFQGHEDCLYLLMANRSLMALEVWDNMRAVDYLCTRAEVDPERIGCTGESGGGAQTIYTTVLDQRIKVAVPVCSVATINSIRFGSTYCPCECLPGIASGWDVSDIAAIIAPRPLLVINGIYDELFLLDGAREAARRLKQVYDILDSSECFSVVEIFAKHGYSEGMREAMYQWFEKWFAEKKPERLNPEIMVESYDSPLLAAWKDGAPARQSNLLHKRFIEAGSDLATRWPAQPASVKEWPEIAGTLKSHIRQLFDDVPSWSGNFRQVGRETLARAIREDVIIESEPGIQIPVHLYSPITTNSRHPAVLLLRDEGKAYVEKLAVCELLLAGGFAVATLDYRGIGETEPEVPRPLAEDPEVMLTQAAIVMGRPLFGMRVVDILAVAGWLKDRPNIDDQKIYGWGANGGALLTLYAAGLSQLFAGAILQNLLISYLSPEGYPAPTITESGVISFRASRSLIKMPSLLLPGILEYGDIPQLTALIAPRPLLIAGVSHGNGRAASLEEMEKAFNWTKKIYSLHSEDSTAMSTITGEDPRVILKWLVKAVQN